MSQDSKQRALRQIMGHVLEDYLIVVHTSALQISRFSYMCCMLLLQVMTDYDYSSVNGQELDTLETTTVTLFWQHRENTDVNEQ